MVGQRVEVTRQSITPFDQFNTGADIQGADLESTDLLPAAGLVFSATKQSKFRLSVSRTLARPQLRELAPFAFSDYFGGRQVSGNPDLGITTMRLMTNNPSKRGGLEGFGLEVVEQVPIETEPTPENLRYLATKRDKLGHKLHHQDLKYEPLEGGE